MNNWIVVVDDEALSLTSAKTLLGASDYIQKPFNKDILIRRIKNTIQNSRKIESLTENATIDRLTGFLNRTSGMERMR